MCLGPRGTAEKGGLRHRGQENLALKGLFPLKIIYRVPLRGSEFSHMHFFFISKFYIEITEVNSFLRSLAVLTLSFSILIHLHNKS